MSKRSARKANEKNARRTICQRDQLGKQMKNRQKKYPSKRSVRKANEKTPEELYVKEISQESK